MNTVPILFSYSIVIGWVVGVMGARYGWPRLFTAVIALLASTAAALLIKLCAG